MTRILSKQVAVPFVFCPSPVTIDKRADWGDNADNFQNGPKGAFLKMKSPVLVSHLVQPKADKSAPVGWVQNPTGPGLFDKAPIWVEDETLEVGAVKNLNTADGPIQYEVKKPSRVCYNERDGAADPDDAWVQSVEELEKNYEMPPTPVLTK